MKTFGPKNSATQNLQVEIQNTPAVTIDDGYVQGTTADGAAFTDNPVVVGGVDNGGLSQSVSVNSDGYVNVTVASGDITVDGEVTVASGDISVDGYVQGTVADGDASVDNPLVAGGVYKSDPTASTLTDGDVGELLINSLRMLIQENRVYDAASDADRTVPVFIPQDRYSFSDLSGSQADSDATISYYVDFQGFSLFSIQYAVSGDGYADLTVHVSNEDVSDITTATYIDVTNDFFGASSFGTTTGDTEKWLERDTPCSCKYIRIDVAVSGLSGGDLSSFDIYFMKKTA